MLRRPHNLKMPLAKRHLLLGIAALLGAGAMTLGSGHADAQGKAGAPDAKRKNAAGGNAAPASPDLALPSAELTVVMIRTTLLSLNDALRTGNYTVLRDLAAPRFREANTAGRLHQIFSGLASNSIDLSAVAIMAPKLPAAPSIDKQRRLHISGHFPGEPIQLNFEMTFEAISGRWHLFGLSVNPVKVARAAAPAPVAGKTAIREPKTVREK